MNPSLGVINNLMSCQTKFFTSTKSWGRATVEVKQLSTNWKVGNSILLKLHVQVYLGKTLRSYFGNLKFCISDIRFAIKIRLLNMREEHLMHNTWEAIC